MSNFFSVHNLIHRDTAFTPGIALSHALHLRSHLAGERILSPTSLKARAQPITRLFEKMGRPDWLNEDHFYLLHSQSPEERAHFFTNNVARVLRPLFDKALVDSVAGAFHPNAETFLKQQKRIAIPFDLLAQSIQAGLITLAGAVTFLTGTLQHIDHLAHLQREQARPKFEPVQSLCVVGMAAGINFIAEGAAWLYLLSPLAALLGCDFLPRLVFSHFLSQHLKLDEPVRSIQTKAHKHLLNYGNSMGRELCLVIFHNKHSFLPYR